MDLKDATLMFLSESAAYPAVAEIAQYGPVGFDAIVVPVLREIDRRKPIRSTRSTWQPGEDPLTAGITR